MLMEIFKNRWNHIWLNEGFASYFEYIGMEAVYDKEFVWQMFFHRERGRAMKHDIIASLKENATVPETNATRTSKEIMDVFGWRVYERGSCMLYMLRSMLGEKDFLSAVTDYLTKNAYSSAVSRDLWKHFEEPAGRTGLLSGVNMTMQNMMEVWVNNSG